MPWTLIHFFEMGSISYLILDAGNWVEKFQTYRITLTAHVLNNADTIVVLVGGQEKAEILQRILEGEYQPDLLPS